MAESPGLDPMAVDGLLIPLVAPAGSPEFTFEPMGLLGVAVIPAFPIAVDGL